jgi:hypothetical protein
VQVATHYAYGKKQVFESLVRDVKDYGEIDEDIKAIRPFDRARAFAEPTAACEGGFSLFHSW